MSRKFNNPPYLKGNQVWTPQPIRSGVQSPPGYKAVPHQASTNNIATPGHRAVQAKMAGQSFSPLNNIMQQRQQIVNRSRNFPTPSQTRFGQAPIQTKMAGKPSLSINNPMQQRQQIVNRSRNQSISTPVRPGTMQAKMAPGQIQMPDRSTQRANVAMGNRNQSGHSRFLNSRVQPKLNPYTIQPPRYTFTGNRFNTIQRASADPPDYQRPNTLEYKPRFNTTPLKLGEHLGTSGFNSGFTERQLEADMERSRAIKDPHSGEIYVYTPEKGLFFPRSGTHLDHRTSQVQVALYLQEHAQHIRDKIIKGINPTQLEAEDFGLYDHQDKVVSFRGLDNDRTRAKLADRISRGELTVYPHASTGKIHYHDFDNLDPMPARDNSSKGKASHEPYKEPSIEAFKRMGRDRVDVEQMLSTSREAHKTGKGFSKKLAQLRKMQEIALKERREIHPNDSDSDSEDGGMSYYREHHRRHSRSRSPVSSRERESRKKRERSRSRSRDRDRDRHRRSRSRYGEYDRHHRDDYYRYPRHDYDRHSYSSRSHHDDHRGSGGRYDHRRDHDRDHDRGRGGYRDWHRSRSSRDHERSRGRSRKQRHSYRGGYSEHH